MDTWRDIRAALPGHPRWQLVGFAAGCAQRLMPMAAGLGGPAVADTADAGLALAWAAAEGRGVQPELGGEIGRLMHVMEASPDVGLEILATHALNLTVFALEAAAQPTPTDRAQAAGVGAIDLLGQVDFLLAGPPARNLVFIEPDEGTEEPPGPLATKEIEAQRTSIALLEMGDRPYRRAVAAVQQLSRARAAELSEVLPDFARRWAADASQA